VDDIICGRRRINIFVALRLLRLPTISLVFVTGVSVKIDPIIDEYVFCRFLAMLRVYNELLKFDQSLKVFLVAFEPRDRRLYNF
jgi:hypothetical protein